MDKKNKGLVDDPTGKIILNESGTSVSIEDGGEVSMSKDNTAADNATSQDTLGNKIVKEDNKE